MNKNLKVHFSSGNNNWKTPKVVYDSLNSEFEFNDDPCPMGGAGGLDRDWGSSTFCNPPYSEISLWVKKAFQQWEKGKTVVLLIPSRTDTKWWHDFIMKATEIRFCRGRLKFGESKNSAPFPSAVIIFKGNDL